MLNFPLLYSEFLYTKDIDVFSFRSCVLILLYYSLCCCTSTNRIYTYRVIRKPQQVILKHHCFKRLFQMLYLNSVNAASCSAVDNLHKHWPQVSNLNWHKNTAITRICTHCKCSICKCQQVILECPAMFIIDDTNTVFLWSLKLPLWEMFPAVLQQALNNAAPPNVDCYLWTLIKMWFIPNVSEIHQH